MNKKIESTNKTLVVSKKDESPLLLRSIIANRVTMTHDSSSKVISGVSQCLLAAPKAQENPVLGEAYNPTSTHYAQNPDFRLCWRSWTWININSAIRSAAPLRCSRTAPE